MQILISLSRDKTVIAASYYVSDGIDQCRVGFLQRQFVALAKTFDGVLALVTEVYSVGSDSPIKQQKCRHNMGCCLAALISDFPSAAKYTTSTATSTFLAKIAKERMMVQKKWCSLPFQKEKKKGLCPMTM